jgi:hypothetical protein
MDRSEFLRYTRALNNLVVLSRFNAFPLLRVAMTRREELEQDIVGLLDGNDARSLEDLIARLPAYSWNEIFGAVDRLTRESKLVLLQSRPSQYLVALHPVEHLSRYTSAA